MPRAARARKALAPLAPPESVRIVGRTYEIVESPGLLATAGCYGQCDTPSQRIIFDPEVHLEQRIDTVLHEVVHGIDEAMVTGLTEEQVRAVSTALLAVLRDNPDFTRFITQ